MSPLALVLCSVLANAPASDPEVSATRASEPEKAPLDLDSKRMLIFVAGRGAGQFIDADPGFGGSAQIGVGVRLIHGLFLQAEIGEGLYAAAGENVGTIIGGLRYELRAPRRLRPSFFLGFTHAHQSSLRDLADAPLATLAGAADTIEHRTGLQVDTALRVPFPRHWRGPLPRFSGLFRADLGYYFDDVGAPLHVGVGAGMSVTF